MGFRITTNMMMNTYRYNLAGSTKQLSDARDQVLTHRNFNSYAEDPASASQAFRLRRQWWQTSNQLGNCDATYDKFHTGWVNLGGAINKLSDANARVAAITGTTGTAGESRTALAQVLRSTSESLIHAMNQKVGDQFIFAGNDGLNVPFSWNEDQTKLYYRGVNVNAGSVKKPTAEEPNWLDDLKATADTTADQTEKERIMGWYNYYSGQTDEMPSEPADPGVYVGFFAGPDTTTSPTEKEGWIKYYTRQSSVPPTADEPTDWDINDLDEYTHLPKKMPSSSDDPIEQGWIDYCKDQADLTKLKAMASEELNLDLGMGLQERADGKLINGSAFDSALCGVEFLNYGVDEDGDPKNLALVMRELADVFQAWDEDMKPKQGYNPELAGPSAKGLTQDELEAKAFRLMDKLNAAQKHTTEKYVELDANSSFLRTNSERLSTQMTNLNEEILDVEQVDLAEAITTFSWDMYCYNAALRVGNQLLSQSLIDYMN